MPLTWGKEIFLQATKYVLYKPKGLSCVYLMSCSTLDQGKKEFKGEVQNEDCICLTVWLHRSPGTNFILDLCNIKQIKHWCDEVMKFLYCFFNFIKSWNLKNRAIFKHNCHLFSTNTYCVSWDLLSDRKQLAFRTIPRRHWQFQISFRFLAQKNFNHLLSNWLP